MSKNWTKKPEEGYEGFHTFKDAFSLTGFPDDGKTKASWLLRVETLSSSWDSNDSKKQLTKTDVDFLESVYELISNNLADY